MKRKSDKYIKMMQDSLSVEEKLHNIMHDKLYNCVVQGEDDKAKTIARAIKIVFPKMKDINICDTMFKAYWKIGQHRRAIGIYNKADKPFWWAEGIGRYYEKIGLVKRAMAEYELLIDQYINMKILPFPKGPIELYKLGKWYIKRDPEKAKKYLRIYLNARRQCGSDPAFHLRYEQQAKKLLDKIQ